MAAAKDAAKASEAKVDVPEDATPVQRRLAELHQQALDADKK
jgi:hypothetical protein